LKEGNYVQGTICLVLRKRLAESNARRMEIEAEIEDAVREKLDCLTALDDAWHEKSHAEILYTDGDLTLAAYAAALQVVTSYSAIDRQPLDRDLYRKLDKGERTMIRDLVDYAAEVANNALVPENFPRDMWRDLSPPERFYVRMLDMESKCTTKVADFQNFAKSFAISDYASLMASTAANAASLKGAEDFKGVMLGGEGFDVTQVRQVPNLGPETQYTAGSFSQPIRMVFGTYVFRAREHVEMRPPGDLAPARFQAEIHDLAWELIYTPVATAVSLVATRLNQLQYLTIRRYLSFVFSALVACVN
jgi:hypothetical protein